MSGTSSVDQERMALGKAADVRLGLRKLLQEEDGPALRSIEAAVEAAAGGLLRASDDHEHKELAREAVLEVNRRRSRRATRKVAGALRRYGADVPPSSVAAAIEERAQEATTGWLERR